MYVSGPLVQVVPVEARRGEGETWLYELVPANALPVVDLSVSLRSRFLNTRWLAWASGCMRHGAWLLRLFLLGVTLFMVTCIVSNDVVVSCLGLLSGVLMLPGLVSSVSVLRYEMVCLLAQTYDFWFFFVTNFGYLIAVSLLMGDARISTAFAFWFGSNINILVDASLRGAKRLVVSNVIVLTTSAIFLVATKVGWIGGSRNPPPYIQYAQGVAGSALLTLMALILRNIVRSRRALRAGTTQQIQCVSYRCVLRLVRRCATERSASTHISSSGLASNGSSVQQLRCVLAIGSIDVRHTVVAGLVAGIAASPLALMVVRLIGAASFTTSFIAAITADYSRGPPDSSSSTVQLTAVALTAAFTVISSSMYLRQVYKVLLSSFDFLYVSTLLTVIHVTACDFFQWHTSPCCVVLTSWLWIHWVLCVDALSPLVKDAFRLHVRFPAVVISAAMAGACLLLYRMIVLDASDPPFDPVLWSGTVFGNAVAFRVMPTFFDSMASVLVWSCRLLYRACRFDTDMLIVLDGPVAYTNYLSRPCQRRNAPHERVVSRQWEDGDNNDNLDQSTQSAVVVRPVKAGG